MRSSILSVVGDLGMVYFGGRTPPLFIGAPYFSTILVRGKDNIIFWNIESRRRMRTHYDPFVAGTGIAVWAVKLNKQMMPAYYYPVIGPGSNKRIQSPLRGDDKTESCGKLICIKPGADGIRQSKPRGDDKIRTGDTDRGVYVIGPPKGRPGHLHKGQLWTHKNGAFRLPWRSGESTIKPTQLVFKVSRPNRKGQIAVKWAWHSFTAAPDRRVRAGEMKRCLGAFMGR